MVLPMVRTAIVAFICCVPWADCLEADWISYSDQADLPMSKKWREEMQAKLASIDTEKLTPEQKKKFKALWRRVEGTSGDSGAPFSAATLVPVGAVALALYLWHTKPWSTGGPVASQGSLA
ncbi:unnamed protein product [Durusdinium trenchii]|uniref:Uncharacterized protein n=1 Tax=Durusdinium trenchii TaxID=1381693 RepID=A0ABP0LGQ3_9DINO